jgi:hypothetical protein
MITATSSSLRLSRYATRWRRGSEADGAPRAGVFETGAAEGASSSPGAVEPVVDEAAFKGIFDRSSRNPAAPLDTIVTRSGTTLKPGLSLLHNYIVVIGCLA